MVGKAILPFWARAEAAKDDASIRLAIEASANATYDPLQKKVLDYSSNGPEHLRTLASTSLSDPRVISLPATQEFLEPLAAQIQRGAQEPERRAELVAPLIKLFSRARWDIPKTEEQQRIFYGLLVPAFPPERGKLEENTRELLQMEKEPADWYLARSIGAGDPLESRSADARAARPIPEKVRHADGRDALAADRSLADHARNSGAGGARGVPEGPADLAEVRERAVPVPASAYRRQGGPAVAPSGRTFGGGRHLNTHPRIRPVLKKLRARLCRRRCRRSRCDARGVAAQLRVLQAVGCARVDQA